MANDSISDRFWSKVVKDPNHPKGCWEWAGAKNSDGYGSFGTGDGKTMRAHRWVYIDRYGEPPASTPIICHMCDNPACVNPDHLYAGTVLDNSTDMVKRERSGNLKLSLEQVEEIKESYVSGKANTVELAERYGVSVVTIWKVVNAQRFSLAGNTEKSKPEHKRVRPWDHPHSSRKITFEQAQEIRRLHNEEHVSYRELQERFGVSGGVIQGILSGRTYKSLPEEER